MPWWLSVPAKKTPRKEAAIVVSGVKGMLDQTIVQASLPASPLREVIDKLARQCDIAVVWSERAERAIALRTMTLQAGKRSILSLLRAIADTADLVCLPEADGLHVWAAEEQYEEAKQAFYLVMDQAPGHPLATLACLRLGQMLVEEGELPRAMTILKRGEGQTLDSCTRAPLVAMLAAAYTLNDDAAKVKTLLAKHREHFQEEPYVSFAALVQGYVRLRQANVKKLAHDGNDLVLALLAQPEASPLANLGKHLAGLAYSDLGMWDQAAVVYGKLADKVKGPLRVEVILRLADAKFHSNQKEAARDLYLSIAEAKTPYAAWARFRLARLDLEEKNLTSCIERCRRPLEEPTGLDRPVVFAVLGDAFERQGDYARAAKCYAGKFPD